MPAFDSKTQEAKTVLYEKNPPRKERGTLLYQEGCGISRWGEKITEAPRGTMKQECAKPDYGGIREGCLGHISSSMWDGSSK